MVRLSDQECKEYAQDWDKARWDLTRIASDEQLRAVIADLRECAIRHIAYGSTRLYRKANEYEQELK